MRWIIFLCLVACANPHRGNGDDDDGSDGSSGSGSNGGSGDHSDSCGGLSRPWLATGQGPSGIVSGDFDRDGVIDLAVSSSLDHTVSVLRGLGGGHFAPKVDYPAYGEGLAVADLDHDGKLDLVAGDVMLIGNDDGSFQTGATIPGLAGGTVATGDFDGDGNPDVANANSALQVVRGLGDRTFGPAKSYALDATAVTLIASDLNHDGKLDVIVGSVGFVDVFLGHGDGTFDGKLSYPLATTGRIAVGDVSGDGVPDLVMPGVQAAILPGMGNGSFGAAQMIATQTPTDIEHVALIDLDHDGVLDIVLGDGDYAEIVHSDGHGTYAVAPALYSEPRQPRAWLAADLDGDGQPDLAQVGLGAAAVGILFADHGAFIAPPQFATANGAIDLALADVDHDQHLDAVVLAQRAGTVSILLGTGDGSFAAKRDAATGTFPRGFAVEDVDGDGRLDVMAKSDSGVDVLRGKGDGTVMAKQSFAGGGGYAMVSADFTSDGKPDALVMNSTELALMANAGDGTFPTVVTANMSIPSNSSFALAAPDLDGNGTPDLAMALGRLDYPSNGGTLATYAGNGAGGFQALDTLVLNLCPTSIASADLNHDGKADLVVVGIVGYVSSVSSTLAPAEVFLGTGGGHFAPPVAYLADVGPSHVTIADVDGDGALDLVIAGNATEVLHGHGDGTFGPRTPYGAPAASAVAGDIDGDGSTDLVATSATGIQVLLGTCH